MTYSSCLHDQQDFCWGNTSRDTNEESQESQVTRQCNANLTVLQLQSDSYPEAGCFVSKCPFCCDMNRVLKCNYVAKR